MPLPSFLNSQILFMLQKTMSKPMSIKRDRKCKIAIVSIYEKSVFLRDKHVGICFVQSFGFGWRSYNVGSLSERTVKLKTDKTHTVFYTFENHRLQLKREVHKNCFYRFIKYSKISFYFTYLPTYVRTYLPTYLHT